MTAVCWFHFWCWFSGCLDHHQVDCLRAVDKQAVGDLYHQQADCLRAVDIQAGDNLKCVLDSHYTLQIKRKSFGAIIYFVVTSKIFKTRKRFSSSKFETRSLVWWVYLKFKTRSLYSTLHHWCLEQWRHDAWFVYVVIDRFSWTLSVPLGPLHVQAILIIIEVIAPVLNNHGDRGLIPLFLRSLLVELVSFVEFVEFVESMECSGDDLWRSFLFLKFVDSINWSWTEYFWSNRFIL